MPRPAPAVPPYRHHKPRDLAFTVVAGRKVYLGRHGSPASREKYARIVREAASGRPPEPTAADKVDPAAVTVGSVLAKFWAHAKRAYPYDPSYDGRRPPGEAGNFYDAMQPLLKLYAGTPRPVTRWPRSAASSTSRRRPLRRLVTACSCPREIRGTPPCGLWQSC